MTRRVGPPPVVLPPGETDSSWFELAECRGLDPALFYPEVGRQTPDAIATCQACAVTEQCLAYANANSEEHGVWGGQYPKQRLQTVRRGGPQQCPICATPFTPSTTWHTYCTRQCQDTAKSRRRRAS